MLPKILPLSALILLRLPSLAANKEHEAIMREIQALSSEVQKLQKVDEKLLELKLLVQQALDMATKANTSITVLERDIKERMREQEKSLVAPVATLGSRLETMTDEFRYVKENMNEVNSRITKVQTQIKDVDEAVKTLPALMAPKPPEPAPAPVSDPAKPQASATDLYENARRDQLAGRNDLAIQGFTEVIKNHKNSEYACGATYHLGEIHYRKDELEKALGQFDDVLEKYGEDCAKHADAMYMKAKTLGKGGQPAAAAKAYRELKTKFPQREWIDKANAGLKELGFATTSPAAGRKKR
jgi:TolA-binding protein